MNGWKHAKELRKLAEASEKRRLLNECKEFVENLGRTIYTAAEAGEHDLHFRYPSEKHYYVINEILNEKHSVYGIEFRWDLSKLIGIAQW